MRMIRKLLIFVAKIVFPQYSFPQILLYVLYCLSRQNVLKDHRLFYIVSPVNPTKLRRELKRNQLLPTCDLNNTIFICSRECQQFLAYLTVRCISLEQRRTVLVVAVPFLNAEHCQILITSNLYHNLKLNNAGCSEASLVVAHLQPINWPKDTLYATELKLSLISNSTPVPNGTIDTVLREYFAQPKLVYAKDVISVDLFNYTTTDATFYKQMYTWNHDEKLYFQCQDICATAATNWCLRGETTLIQIEHIQSAIPKHVDLVRTYNGMELLPLPYGLNDYQTLILKAIQPFLTVNSSKPLPFKPIFLLSGPKGCGKRVLLASLAAQLGYHFYKVHSLQVSATAYAQTEVKIHNVIAKAKSLSPCFFVFDQFENFGKNNEGDFDTRLNSYLEQQIHNVLFVNNPHPILFFCLSAAPFLPNGLQWIFLKTFTIDVPNVTQRRAHLQWLQQYFNVKITDNLMEEIVGKTHSFFLEDYKTLFLHAISHEKQSPLSNQMIDENSIQNAIDVMETNYNDSIGAPKVPKVLWSDIGGLTAVKDELLKTIQFSVKNERFLQRTGLKRSGILLYGPPGTGKTLLAKAIATECDMCFLSVKGPELLNMYVGQSEQNIRKVFEKARQASPCIIFFDELDSLAPNRGFSADSGGVMDRVVSQLLSEMDGLTERGNIFIIGATNRPDLIDTALLRPGRFDKSIYIAPCTDYDSKLSVLQVQTQKLHLDASFSLDDVIQLCPSEMSGADIYGVCSKAWMAAVRRLITISKVDGDDLSKEDVVVTLKDFKSAIQNLQPTVAKAVLDNDKKNSIAKI